MIVQEVRGVQRQSKLKEASCLAASIAKSYLDVLKARWSNFDRYLAAARHQRGPPMHSFRARPICRAQNSFSPSIALWQHFVAPNEYLLKGQLRSPFASEATQRPDDDSSDPGAEGEALDLGDTSNAPPFRKYPAGKGNWQVTAHQRKRPEELRTHMKGKSGRAQFPGGIKKLRTCSKRPGRRMIRRRIMKAQLWSQSARKKWKRTSYHGSSRTGNTKLLERGKVPRLSVSTCAC